MSLQEMVDAALHRVRAGGTDLQDIEAKSAAGGLPERIAHSVCAMANGEGGLIMLGIDESAGFLPVPIDADRVADRLVGACADEIEPPIRPTIDIVEVDGMPVVAAAVPALDSGQKPCFVKRLGVQQGAFIRSHDGNRRLAPFEIHTLESRRTQPQDDLEPAPTASSGLDAAGTSRLIARVRASRGPLLSAWDDGMLLKILGVTTEHGAGVVPTLGGLMAVGAFPQEAFPQLNTTFVAYPTADGRPMQDGTRFLDNQSIDGSIPVQLASALAAVRRNMKRRARIVGAGREDVWEYPEEALREIIVNALMHRDYSPLARGAQVRIEMYPDRLVVSSPGGLFGNVDENDLMSEPVSSSRNAHIAKLLEDIEVPGTGRAVCENRGSGLLALAEALRQAGMQPPLIETDLKQFRITLYNHSLLDEAALAWLTSVDADALTHAQRLGLVLARQTHRLTNSQYRAATGSDAASASRDLSALAQNGWLERSGGRRFAVWTFVDRSPPPSRQGPPLGLDSAAPDVPADGQKSDNGSAVLTLLADGPKSSNEIAAHLGVSKPTALAALRKLQQSGLVQPTESRMKSPKNRWMLSGRREG